jgi:hypothetical protein
VLALTLLTSCARQETASPPAGQTRATVHLRSGGTASGAVVASTPTEIKLAGDDGVTHTIPTSQVRSIEYPDAPAPPPAPVSTATAPEPPKIAPKAEAPARAAEAEKPVRPPASAVTTRTFVLPAGTQIPVRVEETIDSEKAVEGQTYAADVTRDIQDGDGDVVIPRGANARIVIRSSSKGGSIRGASDLVLDLASVSIDGRQYRLNTTDVAKRGKEGLGANRRTAEYTGGAAAVGAIIGAIAGGGKGAAIGAGAGAGAGAAAQVLTKGRSVRVPVETVLTFQLEQPLRVVAAR